MQDLTTMSLINKINFGSNTIHILFLKTSYCSVTDELDSGFLSLNLDKGSIKHIKSKNTYLTCADSFTHADTRIQRIPALRDFTIPDPPYFIFLFEASIL